MRDFCNVLRVTETLHPYLFTFMKYIGMRIIIPTEAKATMHLRKF